MQGIKGLVGLGWLRRGHFGFTRLRDADCGSTF